MCVTPNNDGLGWGKGWNVYSFDSTVSISPRSSFSLVKTGRLDVQVRVFSVKDPVRIGWSSRVETPTLPHSSVPWDGKGLGGPNTTNSFLVVKHQGCRKGSSRVEGRNARTFRPCYGEIEKGSRQHLRPYDFRGSCMGPDLPDHPHVIGWVVVEK